MSDPLTDAELIGFVAVIIAAIITGIVGPIVVDRHRNSHQIPSIDGTHRYDIRPTGKIERLWVEHDILVEKRKGLLIHVAVQTEYAMDIRCEVAAYFNYANGTPLKDINLEYRTVDGQVSVGGLLVPENEGQLFKDIGLFMPYEELHFTKGIHDLKCHVELFNLTSRGPLSKSSDYYFVLNSDNLTSIPKPSGKIENVWVDSAINESGQNGLGIHIKFFVGNLRDIKCTAAAYFYFDRGNALPDKNEMFSTTDGHVAVALDFIPPYDITSYKDLALFIPIVELHLSKGSYSLRCQVDICASSSKIFFLKSNQHRFQVSF